MVGWLAVWVLWHINLCWLFNAKSIFIQIILFWTIQFSISTQFKCQKTFLFLAIQFSQTVLIQTIQFNISTQISSIWPLDRTLSGATTPSQRGPGSDGDEEVFCILQSFSITGNSSSDCLVSYPRQLGGGVHLTPLQRCSWCILQPQPTEQGSEWTWV